MHHGMLLRSRTLGLVRRLRHCENCLEAQCGASGNSCRFTAFNATAHRLACWRAVRHTCCAGILGSVILTERKLSARCETEDLQHGAFGASHRRSKSHSCGSAASCMAMRQAAAPSRLQPIRRPRSSTMHSATQPRSATGRTPTAAQYRARVMAAAATAPNPATTPMASTTTRSSGPRRYASVHPS